jgi:transposase-like protein
VLCATCVGRNLRTNVIERDLVEVRRRTRVMVCFSKVASLDAIIYVILNGYNEMRERQYRTIHSSIDAA